MSPKENSLVWSTICAIFSKLLIKLASAYRFPYRSPKLRLDPQSQKTISLLIAITISLHIPVDKFVYPPPPPDLETTILVYFPSKSLNYTAINLFLQKFSTLTIVKFTISTRTDITLQTNVKYSRAITMCSAFTPIVAMTIALLFSLGTYHVKIQSVQVDYACTKRLFNLSAEAFIKARNAGLCARCAIFLLKIKQIPFSCRLVKGFTFLKRSQNQFKILLEMSIVLASIVPTERNANLLEVM